VGGENVEKARNGGAGQMRAAAPLALLFAAIVIASFAMFSSRIKGNEAKLCEGVARNASEELAAFIDGAAASGAPLAAAIEEDPALWKSGIAAMAKAILDARPYVVGVSVAPSAIVKYHFPEEGNESLIGHDLLSNPERRDSLTAAVERRAPVLSGPYESVDDGRVLFIRYPVFAGGKLWGFTSLTIDFEAMLASLALEGRFPGFSFALSDKDFLAGAKNALVGNRASAAVQLPGVEWTLHAIPAAGWSSQDPFLLVLLVAGIAGALLLFVALWRKPAASASGAASAAGSPAAARLRNLSAFDRAVREAGQLSAARESAAAFLGAGDVGAADGLAVTRTAPDVKPAAAQAVTQATIETAEPAGTGILRTQATESDASTIIDFSAESLAGKKPREVKFIGPAVRGEVYMPERLISGEPGSLFARFAVVDQGEAKTEAKAEAKAPQIPPVKPATPAAPAPERAPMPAPDGIPAPRSQKEFPFTIEESVSAGAAGKGKALAILVVDDSEANREIMGRMLALRDYQADFAVSGEESLERCSRRAYDIVFMDCFMPGMDGYKASAALRERFAGRVGTIVGMSARIGDQELDRCRQAGMDDLLVKPFTLKQMLTHLERR
jgi:CheY-like chemotaxis protein/sensor domain CHASE-containing protein